MEASTLVDTSHFTVGKRYSSESMEALSQKLIKYVRSGASDVIVRLDDTVFQLITRAPQAIKMTGRFYFLARLFYFEIGVEDKIAIDLKNCTETLGQRCKECFSKAEYNVQEIKEHLSCTTSEMEALFKLSLGEMDDSRSLKIIHDRHCKTVLSSVEECVRFCTDNETMFNEMYTCRNEIEPLMKDAEDKISQKLDRLSDDSLSQSKSTEKENLEKMQKCLKRLQTSFQEGKQMSMNLAENWEKVAKFFSRFRRVIEIHLKKDVAYVSESLQSEIRDLDSFKEKSVEFKKEMEISRPMIKRNLTYVQLISELYIRISQSMIALCVEELQTMVCKDFQNKEHLEKAYERLQEKCQKVVNDIEEFCKFLIDIRTSPEENVLNNR